MRIITSIIQFLLILLVGTPKNKKVRLAKQENKISPFLNKLADVALRYAHIILPLFLIILMVLFVFLCYTVVGGSATDSGLTYNHLQDVI